MHSVEKDFHIVYYRSWLTVRLSSRGPALPIPDNNKIFIKIISFNRVYPFFDLRQRTEMIYMVHPAALDINMIFFCTGSAQNIGMKFACKKAYCRIFHRSSIIPAF